MNPSAPVSAVLAKLGKVKRSGTGWSAKCPAHEDKQPSLSVSQGADGRALLTCHAGCDLDSICAALSIDVGALFVEEPKDDARVVISQYDYTDEDGTLVFRVERLFPKSFRQCKPDGKGGWIYKLGSGPRPLYRLPKVTEAIRADQPIWVVEGERDVASLEALGEVATTNAGGAKAWRPEHTQTLAGAAVRIICDRDAEGRKHAESVGESLRAVGCRVEMFEPVAGKDITDHLHAGHALSEIVAYGSTPPLLVVLEGGGEPIHELVLGARDEQVVIGEATIPDLGAFTFEAAELRRERTGIHARLSVGFAGHVYQDVCNIDRDRSRHDAARSLAARLGENRAGPITAAIKLRVDSFCMRAWEWWVVGDVSEWSDSTHIVAVDHLLEPYVARDGGTILFGYKGQGKSWLGMIWAMMIEHGISSRWAIPRPRKTLFVNLERSAMSVERRRAMVQKAIGVSGWRALHRRGRSLQDLADSLKADVARNDIELVVVDSLSRAGTGKLTADDDSNRAMDLLNNLGCAWVVLAHTAKMDGEHTFGSVMHENAADVVVQLVQATSATNPGSIGCRLKITAANDLPTITPEIYALDFDTTGLVAIRDPQPGEFPDLVIDAQSSSDRVTDLLCEEGTASVEEICQATELSRATVYTVLKASKFVKTVSGGGRGKRSVYGLRTVSDFDESVFPGQSHE